MPFPQWTRHIDTGQQVLGPLLTCCLLAITPLGQVKASQTDAARLAAVAYEARANGEHARAAALFSQALQRVEDADRHHQWALDLGYTYLKLDCPAATAEAFEDALRLSEDVAILAALGYARLAAGDESAAISAFERAVARAPDEGRLLSQLGYLHQAGGETTRAADYFRRALSRPAAEAQFDRIERARLRREIRNLENRFWGSATLFWRNDLPDSETLAVGERTLSQSQGLAEANLRFDNLSPGPGRWVAAFSRLIWAIEGRTPEPTDESLQAGIGVKFKPFPSHALVVAAERLVAVGAFARDDWLTRLSYSAGTGMERAPARADWPLAHVYFDLAAIDPADPDLQINAETRLGWGVTTGSLTVTPHLLASAFVQDDALGTDSLLEAGPAVMLRLPIGTTAQHAAGLALELRLAYRVKLAGSANNPDGPTLALSFRF